MDRRSFLKGPVAFVGAAFVAGGGEAAAGAPCCDACPFLEDVVHQYGVGEGRLLKRLDALRQRANDEEFPKRFDEDSWRTLDWRKYWREEIVPEVWPHGS